MIYHIRPGSFDNAPSPFGMNITVRIGDRGGHECHSNSFQSAASVVGRAAEDDDRRASERRHVFVTRAVMGELLNGLNLNIDRVSRAPDSTRSIIRRHQRELRAAACRNCSHWRGAAPWWPVL